MYYDFRLKRTKNTCFTIPIIIILIVFTNILLYVSLPFVSYLFTLITINHLLEIQGDAKEIGANSNGFLLNIN